MPACDTSLPGMGRLRFSMGSLIGVVVLIAVGLGALKSPDSWWAGLVTVAMVGVLLFAILGIAYGQGDVRRFWTGFAVFGWALLILSNPWVQNNLGGYVSPDSILWPLHEKMIRAERPSVSTQNITVWIRRGQPVWIDGEEAADDDEVVELIVKAATNNPGIAVRISADDGDAYTKLVAALNAGGLGNRLQASSFTMRPDWESFHRVGQLWLALVAACIGGFLARTCIRSPGGHDRSPEDGRHGV